MTATASKLSRRLDQRLVADGLAESRSRAQALIKAGAVAVDGRRADRPSRSVAADARIELIADPNPWVSRAGLKLAHALGAFDLSPDGARALDVGASTGGFTEVLLAHGAAQVVALDVGRDQLHPKLRADLRVAELSGRNARDLAPADLPFAPDWIVCDVSFISAAKALAAPLDLAAPGATLVTLVKPQFELGPRRVGKGGVVKDPALWDAARARVRDFVTSLGWRVTAEADSPILGADGNREFLLAASAPIHSPAS